MSDGKTFEYSLKACETIADLRTCEKIRKRRARVRKAVWQGAREGASPPADFNRAGNAARWPFLLSPIGLRVFLAWPALLGRDSRAKGDSLPKARRAMQSIGNTAAGIAAALTPWPSQKSSSDAALCNFLTGS